jgi:hypothetical protein
MMRTELRQRHRGLIAEAKRMYDAAIAAGRAFTADEQQVFDAKLQEADQVRQAAERNEDVASNLDVLARDLDVWEAL